MLGLIDNEYKHTVFHFYFSMGFYKCVSSLENNTMPLTKVKRLYVRFPYNPHYVMCFVEVRQHVSVFVQQSVSTVLYLCQK